MALPVPGAGLTWTPGLIPTAAQLNTNLRDYLAFLINPPLFVQAAAPSTSLANAAWTALSMTTPGTDTYTGWASANPTRYTCQAAGFYDIKGTVGHAANVTGERGASIFLNGAQMVSAQQLDSADTSTHGTVQNVVAPDTYLNVGDYIELRGYQSSGAALATTASGSMLSARWVHA